MSVRQAARRTYLDLAPARRACGVVQLPGSKSVSIRALLLAALAEGETRLESLLDSDDTRVMHDALIALGVPMRRSRGSACNVRESDGSGALIVTGAHLFPKRDAELFVGNSGLSIRTLTAALAFMGGNYRLFGVARMHERPIGDLVDALVAVGARIDYENKRGFPPIHIYPPQAASLTLSDPRYRSSSIARRTLEFPLSAGGRGARGEGQWERAGKRDGRATQIETSNEAKALHLRIRASASSQFVTGLLQAAPLLAEDQPLAIEVEGELISRPYVDLTLALMKRFGVDIDETEANRFVIAQGTRYVSPGTLVVEGDASSASYFLAAGALGAGPVRVVGMGTDSLQGDARFVDALQAMGATIAQGKNWTEASSPGVDLADPRGFRLKAIDADFNHIPDAAMTIAVLALFAGGPSMLRNIGSWRVKETDRIAAMATELRKFGAEVEAGADFLRISPTAVPTAVSPMADHAPIEIATYDDHRIAMCFSLTAFAGRPLRILDPDCVAKTFPDYFEQFSWLIESR